MLHSASNRHALVPAELRARRTQAGATRAILIGGRACISASAAVGAIDDQVDAAPAAVGVPLRAPAHPVRAGSSVGAGISAGTTMSCVTLEEDALACAQFGACVTHTDTVQAVGACRTSVAARAAMRR